MNLIHRRPKNGSENPLMELRKEMNHLFDGFFRDLEVPDIFPFHAEEGGFVPRLDLKENDAGFTVTAEIPGVNEKDLELTVTRDSMTLRGEKQSETKDEKEHYHYYERRYGRFERTVPLPAEVDSSKVEANFKDGVLKVTLPKTETAKREAKKVKVKSG